MFYLKNLHGFSWMGSNSRKATKPLRGDSLLFMTKSPGVTGTHWSKGWKAGSTLEPPSDFGPETPELGVQGPKF